MSAASGPDDARRRSLEAANRVLQAPSEFVDALAAASSADEAVEILGRPPFEFDALQARFVLELTFGQLLPPARDAVRNELDSFSSS